MDDPRYVTLNGFVDGQIGIKDYFKAVSVRKEMVIKVAMGLLTEHLADQIRREMNQLTSITGMEK